MKNQITTVITIFGLAIIGITLFIIRDAILSVGIIVAWLLAATFILATVTILIKFIAKNILEFHHQKIDLRMQVAYLAKIEVEVETAKIITLTAKYDEQVFIRDIDPARKWHSMHLTPSHRINGQQSLPSSLEFATWSAFHNKGRPANIPGTVADPEQLQIIVWPERVDLLSLLPGGADIDNVVLGISVNEKGQHIVSFPLEKMVHVALAGSSGWGKSVAAQSIAYQIATCPQPAELAFIDIEAATFGPFGKSRKLRYKLADTETDALAILFDLADEMNRRKELYRPYPVVDKLASYNQAATDTLPPIVCFIDEASALMGDKEIQKAIRVLALRARKYGIYLLLSGQDFKASTLDSAIRNQMSTRLQLKAQDGTQSRILLGEPIAKDIDTVGRGYALLPGRPLTELQVPYISLQTIVKALANELPKQLPPLPNENEQKIIRAIKENKNGSFGAVSRTLGLSKTTYTNDKIRAVIDKYSLEQYQIGNKVPCLTKVKPV